jgi:hypothetical protein
MVVSSMREFNRALPFKPYKIYMASGDGFPVAHPDFVSISPRGSMVIVFDAKGIPHHLSALLIERVALHIGRKEAKRNCRLKAK